MKTFIISAFFMLVAASAQAGLSTGPRQTVTVGNTNAEMNAVSVPKPAARKVKKKPRRRQDDDDFDIDKD